jgi:hypothetical protein
MRFVSKIIVMPDHNERTSIIIDSTTGLPADTPTTYLILNYLGYRSYNTIESKAKNIAQLWNWLDQNGINLSERMLEGDVLTMEEVASLSKWLSINRSNAKAKNIRVTGGTHQIKTDDCISIIDWLRSTASSFKVI